MSEKLLEVGRGSQVDTGVRADPLQVMWVGDAALPQRFFARRAPHMRIAAFDHSAAQAFLQRCAPEGDVPDLLVLDASATGAEAIQLLNVARAGGLDLPVILLTLPGQESLAIQAGRLAVCDCVIKIQDFVYQLLPAFAQVRTRHDLELALRSARASEERLREIVEAQPTAVCMVDHTGKVLAMNRAGLTLFRARADQVLGQILTGFLPPTEQTSVGELIARTCAGESGELTFSLLPKDEAARPVRAQTVSLPSNDSRVALFTFRESPALADSTLVGDLTAERDRLKQTEAAALAEIRSLRAEREDARSTRDAAESAHAHRVSMQQEHEAERVRLTSSLEAAVARAAELDGESQRLLQRVHEGDRQRGVLQCELDNERNIRERAVADAISAHEAFAEAQQHAAAAGQAASEQEARLTTVTETLRGECRGLRESLSTTEAAYEALLAAQAGRSEAAGSAHETERTQWALDRAALEAKILELQTLPERLLTAAEATATGQRLLEERLEATDAALHAAANRQAGDAALIRDLEAARDRLAGELHEASARCAAIQTEWSDERDRWQAATQDLRAQHDAAVISLHSECRRLTAEVEQVRADGAAVVERLERELGQASNRRSELASALDAATSARDRLSATAHDLGIAQERIAKELQDVHALWNTAQSEWSKERAEWQSATLDLRSAHDAAVATILLDGERLSGELEHAQTACATEGRRRAALERELADAQSRVTELAAALAAAALDRDRLAAEYQDAQSRYEALEQRAAGERDALERASDQARARHEGIVRDLRQQHDALSEELDGLRRQLAERAEIMLQATADRLELAALSSAEMNQVTYRNQHLVEELAVTRDTLRETEARAERLRVRLDSTQAQLLTVERQTETAAQVDREALMRLRQLLVDVLCDADSRCKALIERPSRNRSEMDRLSSDDATP